MGSQSFEGGETFSLCRTRPSSVKAYRERGCRAKKIVYDPLTTRLFHALV
jgi:hypothetical protein